uniref:Uncharacterized protein n=1 Tax=Onchocerca volvulus TaxID=6282 RepID=A0A8R1Y0F4_ONCVO
MIYDNSYYVFITDHFTADRDCNDSTIQIQYVEFCEQLWRNTVHYTMHCHVCRCFLVHSGELLESGGDVT